MWRDSLKVSFIVGGRDRYSCAAERREEGNLSGHENTCVHKPTTWLSTHVLTPNATFTELSVPLTHEETVIKHARSHREASDIKTPSSFKAERSRRQPAGIKALVACCPIHLNT